MATKKTQPKPVSPTISLDQGLELLRDLIAEGRGLAQTNFTKQRVDTWYTSVEQALIQTFGSDSRHIRTFWGTHEVIMNVYTLGRGRDPHSEERRIARKYGERLASLEAIEAAAAAEWRRQHLTIPKKSAPTSELSRDSKAIFIVHGRDDSLREACARFLEKLRLTPIVLHEQANAGRTIIEKFEAHSNVGYAVILLTADDVGGAC